MRHVTRILAAAALSTALSTVPAAPAGAAPDATLEPDQLARGIDVRVPHVDGSTIVDGDRRIEVEAERLTLLATTRGGYVVRRDAPRPSRILLVRRDGGSRVVLNGVLAEEAEVSGDGRLLAYGVGIGDGLTEVVVRRVGDGRRVASRTFGYPGGFTYVHDVSGTRVLLGRSRSGRVSVWDFATGEVRPAAEAQRWVYAGELHLDLLASFTTGGGRCSVVTRISRTDRVLWRSCRERVLSFSPDGRRLATTGIRVHPERGEVIRVVSVRTSTGRLVARYRAESFPAVRWVGDRALLLDVRGSTHSALVRCVADRCRTATDPVPHD